MVKFTLVQHLHDLLCFFVKLMLMWCKRWQNLTHNKTNKTKEQLIMVHFNHRNKVQALRSSNDTNSSLNNTLELKIFAISTDVMQKMAEFDTTRQIKLKNRLLWGRYDIRTCCKHCEHQVTQFLHIISSGVLDEMLKIE